MSRKVIQVNKNPVYENGMVATVFGKDTEFYGDLSFSKSLQINGFFEGEIIAKGFMVVGEGAVVKANIKAKSVVISGTVYGNIEADSKLEIMPSGKLYGNIRTAKLKIADGVVFEGNCEMIKEQKRADLPKKKGEAEAIDA
ncbi:MAG TPA: polymer-forming cytoskeletal protein [Spirochaetota bacterium]|jgi:cytoskeletal protein CcmA (bactofilin family)|nr:polymer-forming cytoskeletal protein [Spirochaetota bacterium]MBP9022728.1 polymer-forming cytoskeletal protein [Spirochaetota bacterium]HOA06476.1 polymer-forming cytoskeletal protein [Spirochaetota bacterium]HOH36245.1 polymer-forming cytoskeletal protein [Spirochaetota bacterium]HPA64094.1 polymer-forming cytoskeletal protein [Spirochaetota bacterium]